MNGYPKLNCWEFMGCGREPGGARAEEFGVCPAATMVSADGLNDGVNGGRVCWLIEDSGCRMVLEKIGRGCMSSCMRCEFHLHVKSEEGVLDLCNTIGRYLTEISPAGAVC